MMSKKRKKKKRKRMKDRSFEGLAVWEYNNIFNRLIDGEEISKIALDYDKTIAAIEKVWWRLCYNGLVRKYQKKYDLFPNKDRTSCHFTRNAKDYMKIQYTNPEIMATPETLAKRMGFSVKQIKDYLIKNRGWKPGNENEREKLIS